MTRTQLLHQVRGRWAWLTAAAAAAGLLVVRRAAPGSGQTDSTETDTKPADETAHGAAAVGTWLRQASTAASSRISAASGAARRELFRNGDAPSEPDTAETAPPAAGTPAAASPEQHKAAPGAGNGSAAQTPAADELPARDR
jgi:hypothetical protein